ncbi:DUF2279 domain-containing protein [Azospirillum himalayense]|uniref:DUF2279 domain-containing protein n=1 Tax=Azospirillum himalayense TaxID=654847 RepID=A0ABW0GE15_9PROT
MMLLARAMAARVTGQVIAGFLTAALLLPGRPVSASMMEDQGWSKEDKALALNVGTGVLALGWGVWSWDWGTGGPRFQDEGWFGRSTTEGGADKIGHAWTGYAISHLLARQYQSWGFTQTDSARYGALSSLGIMGLVEVGDAFSDDYGFSYQDMLFNTVGAVAGYILWDNPELARKVDFRVEYNPFSGGDKYQADVFTDYRRLKYLIAVKADGFDAIQDPLLRHLEFHVGFYARGYEDYSTNPSRDDRSQYFYLGIGLNLTRLLSPHVKTGGVFHYIQPPYTYISKDWRIAP